MSSVRINMTPMGTSRSSPIPTNIRSIPSTKGLVKDTKEKIAKYRANPYANDNKNILRNAPKHLHQKIIDGRIEALEKQLIKQQGELNKVKQLLGN